MIVDDGSSKDINTVLSAFLEDPRVKIIRHKENRGAAAARNTGVSLARGNYIAFLDLDDVWYANKLERQLAWMASEGKAVSCTGYRMVSPFCPHGELRVSRETGFNDLQWGCLISPGSTMLIHKTLFEAVGPFDKSLRRLEDWEWLLRCSQITTIGVVPEILALVQFVAHEPFPYEDVRASAVTIEGRALAGKYPLSKMQTRHLQSTLHSEISAGAFRRGYYGSAMLSLLASHYYHPFKRASYYIRIARAVKGDLLRMARKSSRERNAEKET